MIPYVGWGERWKVHTAYPRTSTCSGHSHEYHHLRKHFLSAFFLQDFSCDSHGKPNKSVLVTRFCFAHSLDSKWSQGSPPVAWLSVSKCLRQTFELLSSLQVAEVPQRLQRLPDASASHRTGSLLEESLRWPSRQSSAGWYGHHANNLGPLIPVTLPWLVYLPRPGSSQGRGRLLEIIRDAPGVTFSQNQYRYLFQCLVGKCHWRPH